MKLFFKYLIGTSLSDKIVDWKDYIGVRNCFAKMQSDCCRRYSLMMRQQNKTLRQICADRKVAHEVAGQLGKVLPQDVLRQNVADCPHFNSDECACYANCECYRHVSDFVGTVREMERMRAMRNDFWKVRAKIRTEAIK